MGCAVSVSKPRAHPWALCTHSLPPSASGQGAPSCVLGLLSWQAWGKRQLSFLAGLPLSQDWQLTRAAGSHTSAGTVPGSGCEHWGAWGAGGGTLLETAASYLGAGQVFFFKAGCAPLEPLEEEGLPKRQAYPHSWAVARWLSLRRSTSPNGDSWLAILPVFSNFQCVDVLPEMHRWLRSPGMSVQPKFPRNNNHSSHQRDLGAYQHISPQCHFCLIVSGGRSYKNPPSFLSIPWLN